jgi:hypothetical protein
MTSWRKVHQSPTGPFKGLAFAWLVGPEQDPKLRDALPGWAIVATVEAPLSVTLADLADGRALASVPAGTPIGLIGFSAGCQAVRAALKSNLAGRDLAFVHVADGTHAPDPPESEPWKVQIWADLAARAKTGDLTFTATTSSMTYTATIPPGQPGRAWPTWWVLGRALGLGDQGLEVGAPVIEGRLYVERFPSGDCDQAAHCRQLADVLPATLKRFWTGDGFSEATGPAPAAADEPATTWRERLAVWAQGQVDAQVAEVPPGSNNGPALRAYAAAVRTERNGRPLPWAPGEAWCALAACAGLVATAGTLDALPPMRLSGLELEQDAMARGTWTTRPLRGFLVIFARPGQSWFRHVGVVVDVAVDGSSFASAEGNVGNGWALVHHATSEARGFIRV